MKRSTILMLGTVATLGLAALTVPVIAQQAMGQHSGMGMMGDDMMGGHGMMGDMMGAQSFAMKKFDTNKDGTLSPEEVTAGIQAELKTYDTDGNGTLSLDEFAVMHADHMRPMTVRAFQMHDADGDGQVTEAEMDAAAEMMLGQMSGQQGMQGMGQGTGKGQGMMDNN